MFLLSLLTSIFFFRVEAGELLIFRSPPSIKFYGGNSIDENTIPEVFSSAMGFTTQGVPKWNGMAIKSPFGFAKGIVVLSIDGAVTLEGFTDFQKFRVNSDENEVNIWKTLRNKIIDRYPVENNTVLRFELGCTEEVQSKYLDKNSEEDFLCLKEVTDLKRKLNNIRNSNGIPDLYWFSARSSNMNSFDVKEKVHELLSKLGEIYSKAYQDQALIVALVGDASHRRRTRSMTGEKSEVSDVSDDLEDNIYDPDFPVIFNIILWFTVALFFSLLAVSVFIASMDPGRDSIIYRMTSNRMKKDS